MSEQIIVVGGGAGGLELVIKLAKKYKRVADVEVTLIDCNPTHIWKPLLHEIATGSLNSSHDETSYLMLAKKHRFSMMLVYHWFLRASLTLPIWCCAWVVCAMTLARQVLSNIACC